MKFQFNTKADYEQEFERLWQWRDLWTRLANRNPNKVQKLGESARFLASLQTRDERIQDRAQRKNLQIGALIKEFDAWQESKKKPFDCSCSFTAGKHSEDCEIVREQRRQAWLDSLPSAVTDPSVCEHGNFGVWADISRLKKDEADVLISDYIADVTVICVDCRTPFHWLGVDFGFALNRPMLSFDGTQLRAPIRPGSLLPPAKMKFDLSHNDTIESEGIN